MLFRKAFDHFSRSNIDIRFGGKKRGEGKKKGSHWFFSFYLIFILRILIGLFPNALPSTSLFGGAPEGEQIRDISKCEVKRKKQ